MRDDLLEKNLRFIIIRAIAAKESYYFFDDRRISRGITFALDALSNVLFELVDECRYARRNGDLDLSNEFRDVIRGSEILKLLVAYHQDIPIEEVKVYEW